MLTFHIVPLPCAPDTSSHNQLLVKYRHSLNGALRVMDNLLRSLRYQMFTVVAADNAVRAVGATKLLEEHFDSSNFGVRVLGILEMTNTNYSP